VPYEASINFGGSGIQVEEVAAGQAVPVNGYRFDGPGIVIREWPLRGVAVCPYGADMNTRSELAQDPAVHVTFTHAGKEPAMSEPKNAEAAPIPAPTPAPAPAVDASKPEPVAEAAKAVEAAEQPAEVAPATVDAEKPAGHGTPAVPGKEPEAPPAAAGAADLSDGRAECKKFLDAFGPKGGEWFAAGKTFTEAQALHAQDLVAENEALKARLAALDRGEKAPVAFQPEQRDDALAKRRAELRAKVGDNLAAFAAEIECKPSKE